MLPKPAYMSQWWAYGFKRRLAVPWVPRRKYVCGVACPAKATLLHVIRLLKMCKMKWSVKVHPYPVRPLLYQVEFGKSDLKPCPPVEICTNWNALNSTLAYGFLDVSCKLQTMMCVLHWNLHAYSVLTMWFGAKPFTKADISSSQLWVRLPGLMPKFIS